MPDITIQNLRVAPGAGPRVPTTVKAFPLSDFLINDADHTAVAAQSPYNGGSPFKSVALAVESTYYYGAADFTLPSTTDSPDNPDTARWGLFVYDANDRLMFPVGGLESFALDHTDTTQDAEDIIAFNDGGLPASGSGDRTVDGDFHVTGDTVLDEDLDVGGNAHVDGNVSWDGAATGSAAGLHSFPGGATLVNNAIAATGSAGINADSDGDGVGEAYLSINSVVKLRAKQDGSAVEATVPVQLPGYATGSLPAGAARQLAFDTDIDRPVYHDGTGWVELARVEQIGVDLGNEYTGGVGSSGSPFTGWDAAINFTAADLTVYVPPGVWEFSTPMVFSGMRQKIHCSPGAILKFTGTGIAISSDAGAATGEIFGFRLDGGPKLVGNAAATIGLLLRGSHSAYVDIDIKDVTTAGLKTMWSVCSDFRITVSKHTGAFTVTPVNGVIFDARGSDGGAHACNIWPKVEWVSGDGIVCTSLHSSVFHGGTSEGNGGRGRYFGPLSTQNTVIGGDDEANGGDDLTDEGKNNVFLNYMTNKAGGTGISRFKGARASIIGGLYDSIIIESSASETQILGGPVYNLSGTGSTVTDSSTSTRYHSRLHNWAGGFYAPNFDATLAGSWLNFGGAWANGGYGKRGDRVFLRGAVKTGTGTIFTLPTGYRPGSDVSFPIRSGTTPAFGSIGINTSGSVIFASGDNTLVVLDGIEFPLP